MGINNLVRTRGFKNFMAKVYGWGAAVVMVGALFKLQHYPGAGPMLIIGLGTEAAIFFFSAFEPPHVEPDWSLVHPELAFAYHGDEVKGQKKGSKKVVTKKTDTVTQELDKMLTQAKIGPELIESLSKGLRNLNNTTAKLSDVSDISLANSGFITNIKSASANAADLSNSYKKTSDLLNKDLGTSKDYINNIKDASNAAAKLSETYIQTNESLQENSKSYKLALENITKNLSALNTIYEVQVKSTGKQADSSLKLNEKIDSFINNLNESSKTTINYKKGVDNLAKNVAALNNVYGNMLTAMNVK